MGREEPGPRTRVSIKTASGCCDVSQSPADIRIRRFHSIAFSLATCTSDGVFSLQCVRSLLDTAETMKHVIIVKAIILISSRSREHKGY